MWAPMVLLEGTPIVLVLYARGGKRDEEGKFPKEKIKLPLNPYTPFPPQCPVLPL